MFVLRVSSEKMKMLEVVLDYYLSDLPHDNVQDLKQDVINAEFYDDDVFHIVLKDLVKEEDPK